MEGIDSSILREDQLVMPKEVYEAAVSGNEELIDSNESDDEYLLRKTSVSNNILHIAIRHEHVFFAHKAAKRFPHLMWETNLDGNTPFHLAAESKERCVGELFLKEVCEKLTDLSVLRKQNSMGNTPLHVAVVHNDFYVAKMLVEKDPFLAQIVNASMEAPLHLALKHFPDDLDNPNQERKVKQQRLTEVMEQPRIDWAVAKRIDYSVEEKMILLIRLLLEKASCVTRWRNASGLTPLQRAASLPTTYNLAVAKYILESCPQSIEVCDSFGKTILHHLINRIPYVREEANKFLGKTHMYTLKNHQDEDGNTPAHLAVINKDIDMLQVLLNHYKSNRYLKNKEGLSVNTLVEQYNLKQVINRGSMKPNEMWSAAERVDIFALIEYSEKVGNFFTDSQDYDGRTTIHKLFQLKSGNIIILEEFLGFIKKYLCFKIVRRLMITDNNGDTPIHILAQINPNNIMIHLANGPRNDQAPTALYPGPQPDDPTFFKPSYQKYTYVWENLGKTDFLTKLIDLCLQYFDRKWLTQNVKGNTALHEALIARNYPLFIKLAEFDRGATAVVNNHNETLLHLLAPLNPIPVLTEDVLENIIKNNTKDERHFYDKDGLSLLVLAIRAGNIEFAAKLCSFCPRLAECRDFKGQTFWHELVGLPPIESSFNFANSSFTDEAVCGQLATKDKQGKTALHQAVECRRFDLIETFLGLGGKLKSNGGAPIFQENLLKIPNNDGITPADMIGELPYVPREFEEFIGKVSTIIGIRSIWGIPSTQMKDYVNAMGVIAALLTTITFTAAFTVPGGLDQEKGTPLLMKKISFQFFIIFDIVAMCLSMMVLFCLLWIMATGNKSKALVLLDFSVILLQASFYTTLVTFMTGLYATTDVVKLWVAIVALVLCSLLILLMQKCLIMKLIIPSGKIVLISFDKAFRYARKLRKKFKENDRRQGSSRRPPILPISSN